MQNEKPHIRYSTPWSRANQSMNSRKIENAVKKLSSFFNEFTDVSISKPNAISFTIAKPFYEYEDTSPLIQIRRELETEFNTKSINKPVGTMMETGEAVEMSLGEFELSIDETDKLIEFMVSKQPFTKYSIESPSLVLSYSFNLIENGNKVGSGSFLIWLQQNSKITANMTFDYETPSREFWNFIKRVEKHTPFKLDYKYLRHATLKKDNSDFKLNKIKQ